MEKGRFYDSDKGSKKRPSAGEMWFSSDSAEISDFPAKSTSQDIVTKLCPEGVLGPGKFRSSGPMFKPENVNFGSSPEYLSEDDIPVIPDVSDFPNEFLNQSIEAPMATINCLTITELNSDLLKRAGFSTLEDIDLAPLVKRFHLMPIEEELDEPWEWENTFSELATQIDEDVLKPAAVNKVFTNYML